MKYMKGMELVKILALRQAVWNNIFYLLLQSSLISLVGYLHKWGRR